MKKIKKKCLSLLEKYIGENPMNLDGDKLLGEICCTSNISKNELKFYKSWLLLGPSTKRLQLFEIKDKMDMSVMTIGFICELDSKKKCFLIKSQYHDFSPLFTAMKEREV